MDLVKTHYYSAHATALRAELGQAISRETMRVLHAKSPGRHLAVAARQFLILGVGTWGLIRFDSPWIWVPLAIVQGFTVFNFTVLLHEVLHLLFLANELRAGIAPTSTLLAEELSLTWWQGVVHQRVFPEWLSDRHILEINDDFLLTPIFANEAQRKTAEAVKAKVDASGKWRHPIVTEIVPATTFTPAEAYHQDYLVKNPGGYSCHYIRN